MSRSFFEHCDVGFSFRVLITAFFLSVCLLCAGVTSAYANSFVQDEYVVGFVANTSVQEQEMIINFLDGDIIERLDALTVHVYHELNNQTRGALRFGSHPKIRYIDKNWIYDINLIPNDPGFEYQPGFHNPENDIDMNMSEAWDVQTDSDEDVVIGVVDTGIDYNHPDLQPNAWVNVNEIPDNGIDDDENGVVDDVHGYNAITNSGNSLDNHRHGTHVAGTLGAVGNNEVGFAGVAWKTQLMSLKFLDSKGSGTLSNAIKVINYAILMKQLHDQGKGGANIRVLNNSWGGGGFSQGLEDAINNANDLGILFVAGTGNNSRNNDQVPYYPASYQVPNVIAVAAVDPAGSLADFSNYGLLSADIAAPGVDVISTWPDGYYGKSSGTSMATPHVSGVAALAFGVDPSITALDLKNVMLDPENVKQLAQLEGLVATAGIPDAAKVMQALDEDDSIEPPVITQHPEDVTVDSSKVAKFKVVATGEGELTYQWQMNGPQTDNEWKNAKDGTSAILANKVWRAQNGSRIRVIVSNEGGSVTSNTANLTVNHRYTLSGKVTLLPKKVPVKNLRVVAVRISNGNKRKTSAKTDEDGNFKIVINETGRYELVIRNKKYEIRGQKRARVTNKNPHPVRNLTTKCRSGREPTNDGKCVKK